MNEAEWFQEMARLAAELHRRSHTIDGASVEAQPLVSLAGAFADVLEWLTVCSSWHQHNLTDYDKMMLRHELEQRVLWRLQQ